MNFCSLADSAYLTKLRVLYHSMRKHAPGAKLYVLALDDKTYRAVAEIDNVHAITLYALEREQPRLLEAKKSRTQQEYAWLLASVWTAHIFNTIGSQIENLVYLDTDTRFFSDPTEIYSKYAKYPVSLLPHHFAEKDKIRESTNGFYNVNWVAVSNF